MCNTAGRVTQQDAPKHLEMLAEAVLEAAAALSPPRTHTRICPLGAPRGREATRENSRHRHGSKTRVLLSQCLYTSVLGTCLWRLKRRRAVKSPGVRGLKRLLTATLSTQRSHGLAKGNLHFVHRKQKVSSVISGKEERQGKKDTIFFTPISSIREIWEELLKARAPSPYPVSHCLRLCCRT